MAHFQRRPGGSPEPEATLTEAKRSQSGKDAQRCYNFKRRTVLRRQRRPTRTALPLSYGSIEGQGSFAALLISDVLSLLHPIGLHFNRSQSGAHFHTIRVLKSYQIWDGFFVLAKLSGGRRSSATLTEAKRSQSGKDAQRCYDFKRRTV